MNIKNITPVFDGAIPLILKYCRKLKIAEFINNKVEYDKTRRIISPGTAVEAIIANILSNRRPLSKLDEFYEDTDVEKYFGKNITAKNLKDDTLGRALDDLYSIGAKDTFSTIAIEGVKIFNVEVKSIHADTTSKTVYGQYSSYSKDEECVKIQYGHSKDKRPDLKQLMFGLACTGDRTIVSGEVLDGNTSDKTWNTGFIKKMRTVADKLDMNTLTYVADSAAVTTDNLDAVHECGLNFISLMPSTFNIEKELKEKAYTSKDNWLDIGKISTKKEAAEYKIQSFIDEINGRKYRFIVCYSSSLDNRKIIALKKNISKEKTNIEKIIKNFEKQEYYCEKDALSEFHRFVEDNKLNFHIIDGTVCSEEKRKKKEKSGRLKAGQQVELETKYKVKLNLCKNDESIDKHRNEAGMFVLITNIIDPEKLTDGEVLREYKEQIYVETNFKALKNSDFIDEIYLKTPERIEALGYIFLLALMVYTSIEREVRKALKKEKEPLIIPGKIKSHTPTASNIMELLEKMLVLIVTFEDGTVKRQINKINANLKRLLVLAGFNEKIYVEDYIT